MFSSLLWHKSEKAYFDCVLPFIEAIVSRLLNSLANFVASTNSLSMSVSIQFLVGLLSMPSQVVQKHQVSGELRNVEHESFHAVISGDSFDRCHAL